jgi:hypothetical protein
MAPHPPERAQRAHIHSCTDQFTKIDSTLRYKKHFQQDRYKSSGAAREFHTPKRGDAGEQIGLLAVAPKPSAIPAVVRHAVWADEIARDRS